MDPSTGINSYPLRLFHMPNTKDTAIIIYRDEQTLEMWKQTRQISSIAQNSLFLTKNTREKGVLELGYNAQFIINFADSPARITFMRYINNGSSLESFCKKFDIEIDMQSLHDQEFQIAPAIKQDTKLTDDEFKILDKDTVQKMTDFSILSFGERETLVSDLKRKAGTSDIVEAVSDFLGNLDYERIDDVLTTAHCYFYGIGLEIDYDLSMFFYEMAAKTNSVVALIQLGYILISKPGMNQWSRDDSEANLLAASNLGSSTADVLIGLCHVGCYFELFDIDSGLKAYKQAANRGNPQGLIQLALYYRVKNELNTFYRFVSENKLNALLERAAKDGDPEAQFFYAEFLMHNQPYAVTPDMRKAQLETLLAGQKNGLSLLNSGIAHLRGLGGVELDNRIALEYIYASIQYKQPEAYFIMGLLFETGTQLKQCIKMAIDSYNEGIKREDANSMFHFARCLWLGIGREQQRAKAVELIQNAASLGHPVARHFCDLLSINSPIIFKSAHDYLNSLEFVV